MSRSSLEIGKFVAHLVPLEDSKRVPEAMRMVKSDPKIARATHNIFAFRIRTPDGQLDQHRDDDGETGAGDKLLDLLDKCNIENVLLIVTRWYGGIQLGPDRFKHINELALNLLKQEGFLGN